MYLVRIVHTPRRHNDSSGSMILVHTMVVVLQIGATSCCCLVRYDTLVCTGQRRARARVVLWSTPHRASMKHFEIFPSDTGAAYFFHLGYSALFRYFDLNQSQRWICMIQPQT